MNSRIPDSNTVSEEVKGDCFQASLDFILNSEGLRASLKNVPEHLQFELVHGTAIANGGTKAGERVNHAWVELGDSVIDPSRFVDQQFPKDAYYAKFSISPVCRFSRAAALEKFQAEKSFAYWGV